MAELRLDENELRVELAIATDAAIDLADKLAIAVLDGPTPSAPVVARLAREYQEQRLQVRRLRRALQVEVAG